MRIAHISDLHFGRHDNLVAAGLAADIASQKADLVVASGDFTQRGTAAEFKQARQFLDTLAAPLFAVPGNHDVPAVNLLRRFVDPYGLYRRFIARTLEPFVEIGGVALAGLKTARRARFGTNWSHGSISRAQLEHLEARFSEASAGALRIIVAHHPLLRPEEQPAVDMRPVANADRALAAFSRIGVRVVLSGHFHLSYVRRHEPSQVRDGVPTGPRKAAGTHILVVQAASTISTRLRGAPNAYNILDIAGDEVTVRVREWQDAGWMTRETAQTSTG
jgi:3',5'-cyclic AMP phosphodiesterase CpdA